MYTSCTTLHGTKYAGSCLGESHKAIIISNILYSMKHFSFRLGVIYVCPVLVPSELLLSTHLPTSEGWTAELTAD